MLMFRPKSKRRSSKLRRMSEARWADLPDFLMLRQHEHFGIGQTAYGDVNPDRAHIKELAMGRKWRVAAIELWLDEAENDARLARKLDRLINLYTDDEDGQYYAHWSIRRNKVYFFVAIGSALVSITSLIVSLYVRYQLSILAKLQEALGD